MSVCLPHFLMKQQRLMISLKVTELARTGREPTALNSIYQPLSTGATWPMVHFWPADISAVRAFIFRYRCYFSFPFDLAVLRQDLYLSLTYCLNLQQTH